MNLMPVQSEEARAEAEEVMLVDHNILKDDCPIVRFVQNSVTSAYLLTQAQTRLRRDDVMQMLAQHSQPVRLPWVEFGEAEEYTGQQVFSCLLPPDFELASVGVLIRRGVMLEGQWTAKSLNGCQGLIHVMVLDYGDSFTADFITGVYNVLAWYASSLRGITVSLDDCFVPRSVLGADDLEAAAKEYFQKFPNHDVQARSLGAALQERNFCEILDLARDVMGHRALKFLEAQRRDNGLRDMVNSGAKGKVSNLVQTTAAMGQQRNHLSKRFPRTTCHFTHPMTDPVRGHGMVYENFTQGMESMGLFFHLQASRSGLVDTAVKSVTGDTELVLLLDGKPRRTTIGQWVDQLMISCATKVQHRPDLELLGLRAGAFIPSMGASGTMMWAAVTAVTRHDPSEYLYEVKTLSGRSVTVVESKSLLVWDEESKVFVEKNTLEVRVGDFLPTAAHLPSPASVRLPEKMQLTTEFGFQVGLYLAEDQERARSAGLTALLGLTFSIHPRSPNLTALLQAMMGTGGDKRVPNVCYGASDEFLASVLDGYLYGGGHVGADSIETCRGSSQLADGVSWMLARLGVFAVKLAQPSSFSLSISGQWARVLSQKVKLSHPVQQAALLSLREASADFAVVRNVVLDRVVSIRAYKAAAGQKVYDLTVPATLNFGLANGLQVRDTAFTGYMQRRITKSLEDMVTDGSGRVVNAQGGLMQLAYGGDGFLPGGLEYDQLRVMEGETQDETVLGWRRELWAALEVHRDKEFFLRVLTPVNFRRLRLRLETLVGARPSAEEWTTWSTRVRRRLLQLVGSANRKLVIYLEDHWRRLGEWQLSREGMAKLERVIERNLGRARVPRGEMVGLQAAQSMGEPLTQMTLDSFHESGALSALTTGVPRIHEIVNAVGKRLATPSMKVFFRERVTKAEAEAFGRQLIQRFAVDFITGHETGDGGDGWSDPDGDSKADVSDLESEEEEEDDASSSGSDAGSGSEPEEEETLMDETVPSVTRQPDDENDFHLTLHLSKELPSGIRAFMAKCRRATPTLPLTWRCGKDADQFWVRLSGSSRVLDEWARGMNLQGSDEALLEDLLVEQVGRTFVSGLRNMVDFAVDQRPVPVLQPNGQVEWTDQFYLVTRGSNLKHMLTLPWVDTRFTVTNDILEIERLLGVDAAKQAIQNELTDVMAASGATVKTRHLALLAERMSFGGKVVPTTYSGICLPGTSVIRNASYENSIDTFLASGLAGDKDECQGMTECVVVSRSSAAGVGSVELVMKPDCGSVPTQRVGLVEAAVVLPTKEWLQTLRRPAPTPVVVTEPRPTVARRSGALTSASRRRRRALQPQSGTLPLANAPQPESSIPAIPRFGPALGGAFPFFQYQSQQPDRPYLAFRFKVTESFLFFAPKADRSRGELMQEE